MNARIGQGLLEVLVLKQQFDGLGLLVNDRQIGGSMQYITLFLHLHGIGQAALLPEAAIEDRKKI